VAVRRCYITDGFLDERVKATGRTKAEIVAAVLPDAGSTMSGDFGEILVPRSPLLCVRDRPTAEAQQRAVGTVRGSISGSSGCGCKRGRAALRLF
jgi:hypothetical protein